MNRRLQTALYPLLMLLLWAGCSDESRLPAPSTGNIEWSGERATYTLYTNVPPLLKPITRTGMAAEDAMAEGDFWVFVFDNTFTPSDPSNIKLLEVAKAEATTSTAPGPYKWITTLKTRNHPVKIVMLANAPAQVYAANSSGGVAISATSFPVDMTYADAIAKLYTAKLNTSLGTVPYTPELMIPMCSVADFAELSSQINLGTDSSPLALPRIVAKISVDNVTSANNNFTLLGANLHNAPSHSCLIPRTVVPSALSFTTYEGTTVGQEITGIAAASSPNPLMMGVKETTATNPLYCYETNFTNLQALFLIVQGSYKGATYYYKMTVNHTTGGAPITAIRRNTHYRFLIEECTARGYDTYDEAIAAPTSNLHYRVEVTDLSSHDIIDNGQYYLGLSNTEYHLYASGGLNHLPVTTLNTGTNPGASTFTGNVSITSSDPTNLFVQSSPINHPVTDEIIRVGVTENFTGGTLTLKLGNLVKTINVVRKSNSAILRKDELIVNNNYATSEYKVASVADPKPWIKLGNSPAVTLVNGQDQISSDEGGVYIAYNGKLAGNDAESFIYISRGTHEGRIKAHFLLSP